MTIWVESRGRSTKTGVPDCEVTLVAFAHESIGPTSGISLQTLMERSGGFDGSDCGAEEELAALTKLRDYLNSRINALEVTVAANLHLDATKEPRASARGQERPALSCRREETPARGPLCGLASPYRVNQPLCEPLALGGVRLGLRTLTGARNPSLTASISRRPSAPIAAMTSRSARSASTI